MIHRVNSLFPLQCGFILNHAISPSFYVATSLKPCCFIVKLRSSKETSECWSKNAVKYDRHLVIFVTEIGNRMVYEEVKLCLPNQLLLTCFNCFPFLLMLFRVRKSRHRTSKPVVSSQSPSWKYGTGSWGTGSVRWGRSRNVSRLCACRHHMVFLKNEWGHHSVNAT